MKKCRLGGLSAKSDRCSKRAQQRASAEEPGGCGRVMFFCDGRRERERESDEKKKTATTRKMCICHHFPFFLSLFLPSSFFSRAFCVEFGSSTTRTSVIHTLNHGLVHRRAQRRDHPRDGRPRRGNFAGLGAHRRPQAHLDGSRPFQRAPAGARGSRWG